MYTGYLFLSDVWIHILKEVKRSVSFNTDDPNGYYL